MKLLLDENLSPRIAKALNELSGQHEVTSIREKFGNGVADLDWIEMLSKEGGWAIISKDRFTKQNGLEKEALKKSGLIVFSLQRQWRKATFWDQAQRLVKWYPLLIQQAETIQGGAAFEVPFGSYKLKQA